MKKFNKIGILGRPFCNDTLKICKRLYEYLLSCDLEVILEQQLVAQWSQHNLVLPLKKMREHCDLVMVVGGDGSMLGASRILVGSQVPLLGINRGNLGFLTDISSQNLEKQIADVIHGNYFIEERFLLEVSIYKNNQLFATEYAFNEMVLHPSKWTKMIEFEIFIDRYFVMSQKSDGVIISTPTGSTAYALSAGGPIMHPKLNALSLIPMYPHTLSNRPLVIDGNSKLKIGMSKVTIDAQITCDGQINLDIAPRDFLLIEKKSEPLLLIHATDHNYYKVCRTKLGWGHRLDEK